MSINLIQHKCPSCGAPLDHAKPGTMVCSFCETRLRIAKEALPQFHIPEPLPTARADSVGRVTVDDQAYLVHGRLARGEHCDAYLARRDSPLTELVVLKIARSSNEHLRTEWTALARLAEAAIGSFVGSLLPRPVQLGKEAAVYGYRSGFNFTFTDARNQYADGVDPAATVWMWNRVLEQIGDLQRLGYCHGAVAPEHLLIHPRDHGVALCGWSRARRAEGDDVAGSARSIGTLLGTNAPRALLDLLRRAPQFADAFKLKAELKRVAEEAFGPPRFVSFKLG